MAKPPPGQSFASCPHFPSQAACLTALASHVSLQKSQLGTLHWWAILIEQLHTAQIDFFRWWIRVSSIDFMEGKVP